MLEILLSLGKEGAGGSTGSEGERDQGWGLLGPGRGKLDGEGLYGKEPLTWNSETPESVCGGGQGVDTGGKVTLRPWGL